MYAECIADCDVLLTLSAPGEAPLGLPLAVQSIGIHDDDERVPHAVEWIWQTPGRPTHNPSPKIRNRHNQLKRGCQAPFQLTGNAMVYMTLAPDTVTAFAQFPVSMAYTCRELLGLADQRIAAPLAVIIKLLLQ